MDHSALEKEAANSIIKTLEEVDDCKIFNISSPGDSVGSYNPFATNKLSDIGRAGVGDLTLKEAIKKSKKEFLNEKIDYITPFYITNPPETNIKKWNKEFFEHNDMSYMNLNNYSGYVDDIVGLSMVIKQYEEKLIGHNTMLIIPF